MRALRLTRAAGAIAGLMVAIAIGPTPAHAQEAAVSADLVVRLLEAGLNTTAVINEISGRCIDFSVDSPGVEQRLRAAGGDNQLLQRLRGFCYAGSGSAGALAFGRTLYFGLFAGFANSSIVGYETTDVVEARRGPNIGVEVSYQPDGSGFGLQTGLIYVPKGEYVPVSATIPVGHTLRLDYVEIPLLARWAFDLNGSSMRPVLLAGASLGLKTACLFEFDSGADLDCEDNIEVNAFDVGASVGVGVDVAVVGRWSVSPSIRYSRGMTTVASGQDGKNSSLQAGVSIRIAN